MPIEHHDLAHELPEHKDKIHDLKMNDRHFKKLFEQYHSLTHSIEGFEKNNSNIDEEELKKMKKNRLELKDRLYKIIKG